MQLNKFKKLIIKKLSEEVDYSGKHEAPNSQDDYSKPMHKVYEIYPNDIYGPNAYRYYAYGEQGGYQAIRIIQDVKDKPNAKVKIYRAIPNFSAEIDSEVKLVKKIIKSYEDYGFANVGEDYVDKIEKQIQKENPKEDFFSGDEARVKFKKMVEARIIENYNSLQKKQKEIKKKYYKINDGDWVTIILNYAALHGKSALNNNYKIVTKTVKASQLYTDANSVFEWGYDAR